MAVIVTAIGVSALVFVLLPRIEQWLEEQDGSGRAHADEP